MFAHPIPSPLAATMLLSLAFVFAFHDPGSIVLAQQKTKIWSDNTGAYSVEAVLVEISESNVALKKQNGVVVHVPFERLSDIDLKFVRRLQADSKRPPKRPVPVVEPHTSTDEQPPSNSGSDSDPNVTQDVSFEPAIETDQDLLARIGQLPQPLRQIALDVAANNSIESRLNGLSTLVEEWPKQNSATLTQLVRKLTQSSEFKIRRRAVEILAKLDAVASLELILAGTEDKNYSVRMTSYAWIERLKDPRSIDPLVEKLKTPTRDHAASSLVAFGSAAEPKLLPLIKHDSADVQLTACSLLAKIGSQVSLPELTRIAASTQSIRVRMQARNAIQQIQKRAEDVAN